MFELFYTMRTDHKDYSHVAVVAQHQKDLNLAGAIIFILTIVWMWVLWAVFNLNLIAVTIFGAISAFIILHTVGFIFDQLARYAFNLHCRDFREVHQSNAYHR